MAYNGLKTQPPHRGSCKISRNTAVFSLFAYFTDLFFISASDQIFCTSFNVSTRMLLLLLKRKTSVWRVDLHLNEKNSLKKMNAGATGGSFFLSLPKDTQIKVFLSWSESYLKNKSLKYEKSKIQTFEILISLKNNIFFLKKCVIASWWKFCF